MKKKPIDQDMDLTRTQLKGILTSRYKRPLWDQFKDAVGVFFLGIAILICLAVVVFLIVTLIENPVSLAIICGTVLLAIMWGTR